MRYRVAPSLLVLGLCLLGAPACGTGVGPPQAVGGGLVNNSSGNGVVITPPGFFDLDLGRADAGVQEFVFREDPPGNFVIEPAFGRFSLWGRTRPRAVQCSAEMLTMDPIPLTPAVLGMYYCYVTSDGRYGSLTIDAYDPTTPSLTISFTTAK